MTDLGIEWVELRGKSEAILAMYTTGGMYAENIASILGLSVEEVTAVIKRVH